MHTLEVMNTNFEYDDTYKSRTGYSMVYNSNIDIFKYIWIEE
jgi:hypothetical protein